ncbi:MAG: hypothetical protein ACOZB3_07690 [Calditrichota bacterium]
MNKAAVLFTAVVLCIAANPAFGFDIAIYKDPLTYWNERYLSGHRFGYVTDAYGDYLNGRYRAGQMDSVYQWYGEMGVSHVMVIYPFSSNFSELPADCSLIKVMNWFHPGEDGMYGFKYVDAQFRDVQVGYSKEDLPDGDPRGYWSCRDAIRSPATRTTYDPDPQSPAVPQLPCVAMSGSADTLWRATSYLGTFSGWDYITTGWLDSSIYMPMHFRLTWAMDPNGSITTETPLADFYWMVQIPADRQTGTAQWWRFPVKTLTLPQLSDTNNWITSLFYEDARSGVYTLLDSNFAPVGTASWADIHYGSDTPTGPLDEVPWNTVSYTGSAVRMSVYYHGTHAFYLNRIEVYDEGSYRLFASDSSVYWQSSIATAYADEYIASGGRSAGWYYDEWTQSGDNNGSPAIRSLVKLDSILQYHTPSLPTFFTNGHPGVLRTQLYDEEDRQNVNIPVQMDEFYLWGGATLCQPYPKYYGGIVPGNLWTTDSSDVPYISAVSCGTYVYGDGTPQEQYHGWKSLQCAIDSRLWGYNDVFLLNDPPIDYPPCCPNGIGRYGSFIDEVQLVHAHNDKLWALLQGGQDVSPDCTWNCCAIRVPTSNQVKLNAWLAIACDVDGIMWYPWDFGGLIEEGETAFERNDRYYAAKKTCNEIQYIAPILESLEFVKTYTSRAFELDYPYNSSYLMEYPAIYLDTLAYEAWYGRNYRCVESIQSWSPSALNEDTTAVTAWNATPEEHTYVQVSRFRSSNTSPNEEDYWFLIVNRRALSHEFRKIRLTIEVNNTMCVNRWADYVLGDSMVVTEMPENREDCNPIRYLDVILAPGEAELIHFFRDLSPCDSTLAHIHQLTAIPRSENGINLHWEQITQTDSGEAFTVDTFFVRASRYVGGPYTTIGFSTTNSYVDTSGWSSYPKCFYQVQACGHLPPEQFRERPAIASVAVKAALQSKTNK